MKYYGQEKKRLTFIISIILVMSFSSYAFGQEDSFDFEMLNYQNALRGGSKIPASASSHMELGYGYHSEEKSFRTVMNDNYNPLQATIKNPENKKS